MPDIDIINRLTDAIESIDRSMKMLVDLMQPEGEQKEQPPEPIPTDVIFKPASGNFVDSETGQVMDKQFREQWIGRKNEFPRR